MAGNYTIYVQNEAGANAYTYEIVVYLPPVFKDAPQNPNTHVNAFEGTSIRFNCDVEGLPTPNVYYPVSLSVVHCCKQTKYSRSFLRIVFFFVTCTLMQLTWIPAAFWMIFCMTHTVWEWREMKKVDQVKPHKLYS